MSICLLSWLLAASAFQGQAPQAGLTVTLEVFDWHSRKEPGPLVKPGDIPAGTKPATVVEVDTMPGSPFAAKVTVGTKTYFFSGVIDEPARDKFVSRIEAAVVENFKLANENMTNASSKLTLAPGERIIIGGSSGRRETAGGEVEYTGTAFRVSAVRKAR